jgi:hypothetical protein
MKTKQLLYMLVALVVVIAIIVASKHVANKKQTQDKTSMYPKMNVEEIFSCTIISKDSTVKLVKKEGTWVVPSYNNYRADTSVNGMIKSILQLNKKDLVSTKPGNFAKFGLDSASDGIRAILGDKSGKSLVDIWFGQRGADYQSEYVRLAGSNEVYAVEGSSSNYWRYKSKNLDWKDKRIWILSKDLVQKVTVSSDSLNFTLEKNQKGDWEITAPQKSAGDKTRVDAYVTELCNFQTSEWATPADSVNLKKAFTKPALTLQVNEISGKEHKLILGSKKEGSNYLKVEGDSNIYLINTFMADSVLKRPWKGLVAADTTAASAASAAAAKAPLYKNK